MPQFTNLYDKPDTSYDSNEDEQGPVDFRGVNAWFGKMFKTVTC